MGLRDLVKAIIAEDIKECAWYKSSRKEKQICQEMGEDYTQTQYHKMGCDNCDGYSTTCAYSPNYVPLHTFKEL